MGHDDLKWRPWEFPSAPGVEQESEKSYRRRVAMAKEPMPRDQSRFDQLLTRLSDWRNADHEDNLVLCRSDVIEIIEGVATLRKAVVLAAVR